MRIKLALVALSMFVLPFGSAWAAQRAETAPTIMHVHGNAGNVESHIGFTDYLPDAGFNLSSRPHCLALSSLSIRHVSLFLHFLIQYFAGQ